MTWHQVIRLALALLVSAGVVLVAIRFGDVGRYREAASSMRVGPLLGVAALLIICNVLRVARLKILLAEASGISLARIAFLHQFLTGMFPVKLGELALPLMLARSGMTSASGAVGVLLGIRLLDVVGLLVVASVALVAIGGSIDQRVPAYALVALFLLLLLVTVGLYVIKTMFDQPMKSGRFQRLVRSLMMPVACLTLRDSLKAAGVTFAIWTLLLSAFYVGCVSFGLSASLGEVVVSGAAGNLIAALPVNGVGGVGGTQLSWAGLLAAFGSEFETALIVGIAVQAVALAVAGGGAAILSVWLLLSRRNQGDVRC